MKVFIYVGLIVLFLGVASLIVPIPHTRNAGLEVGSVSIGIQTEHDNRTSPVLSGGLILCGAALMIVGKIGT
jgi:hypothetical protein